MGRVFCGKSQIMLAGACARNAGGDVMKIGVFLEKKNPFIGGGYVFQQAILSGLREYSGRHEFVILSNTAKPCPDFPWPWVAPRRPHWTERGHHRLPPGLRKLWVKLISCWKPDEYECRFDEMMTQYGVDCMWFPEPIYQDTELPFFITIWDLEHRNQPWFPEFCPRARTTTGWNAREALYNGILPRAARIITGTEVGKQQICRYHAVNPDNVFVNALPVFLPKKVESTQGVSTNDILRHYGIPDGYFFYPAQFWAHKNHAGIIAALDLLIHSKHRQVHVVFCGRDLGNKDYIQELARQKNLQNNITFLDFVKDDELQVLYRHAEALLYASLFGPDNLPPLEAFSCDCPVLAHDSPGSREQLGEAALYFSGTSATSIANAMELIMINQPLRQQLIHAGRSQLAGRTVADYFMRMDRLFDEFEPLRQMWAAGRGLEYT
jgi:glycosyltransferase involved in cell wall biosynthesis